MNQNSCGEQNHVVSYRMLWRSICISVTCINSFPRLGNTAADISSESESDHDDAEKRTEPLPVANAAALPISDPDAVVAVAAAGDAASVTPPVDPIRARAVLGEIARTWLRMARFRRHLQHVAQREMYHHLSDYCHQCNVAAATRPLTVYPMYSLEQRLDEYTSRYMLLTHPDDRAWITYFIQGQKYSTLCEKCTRHAKQHDIFTPQALAMLHEWLRLARISLRPTPDTSDDEGSSASSRTPHRGHGRRPGRYSRSASSRSYSQSYSSSASASDTHRFSRAPSCSLSPSRSPAFHLARHPRGPAPIVNGVRLLLDSDSEKSFSSSSDDEHMMPLVVAPTTRALVMAWVTAAQQRLGETETTPHESIQNTRPTTATTATVESTSRSPHTTDHTIYEI